MTKPLNWILHKPRTNLLLIWYELTKSESCMECYKLGQQSKPPLRFLLDLFFFYFTVLNCVTVEFKIACTITTSIIVLTSSKE